MGGGGGVQERERESGPLVCIGDTVVVLLQRWSLRLFSLLLLLLLMMFRGVGLFAFVCVWGGGGGWRGGLLF